NSSTTRRFWSPRSSIGRASAESLPGPALSRGPGGLSGVLHEDDAWQGGIESADDRATHRCAGCRGCLSVRETADGGGAVRAISVQLARVNRGQEWALAV